METLMEPTTRTEHPLQAMPGFDIRPYLPHAIAATLGVFGLPAAFVLGMVMLPSQDPSVIVTSGLSVGLSTVASVIGNSIWMRNPASTNVSFGDLMIWGWMRRRHAERKLNRGTRMLGLDRRGQPTRQETTEITRDKQLKVLHELNDALEAKDPYTRGHSERVERHVYRTAAAMGLSVHDLQELRMAAALHDIGKIRVPDRIIRKPGKLTDEERSIMEEHSAVGSWMLSHVASADVISAVRHHHERWDGKGYPDGLAGTDIPLYARIIAVCDTFDAITSTRPYRAKSDREYAIEIIKAETGTQFDPMAVDVFLKSLPRKVPITAMLLMLPGAGRVLREFARALKRAGASSLASATTAASASVIVAAATVAPAIDRMPVRVPEPVAAGSFVSAPSDTTEDSTISGAPGPSAPSRTGRAGASSRSRVASVDADLERETFDIGGEPTPEGSAAPTVLEEGADTGDTTTTGQDNSQAGEDHGKAGEKGNGAEKGKAGEDHGKAGDDPGKAGGGHGKPDKKPDKPGKPAEGTTPGNGNDNDDSAPDDPGTGPGNGNPAPGNGNGNPAPGNGNGNGSENGNPGGNGNGNAGGSGNAGGNSDDKTKADDAADGEG